MAAPFNDEEWKYTIHQLLLAKNAKTDSFKPILRQNETLQTKLQQVKKYNDSLEQQIKELQLSNNELTQQGFMSHISHGKVDRTPDLMERLQRLQEDLTASYKRNSEDATAMLNLTNQIQDAQRKLSAKDEQIAQLQIDLERSIGLEKFFQSEVQAAEQKFKKLRQEFEDLQKNYIALENEKEMIKKENNELVNRWLTKVEEDAKKINLANEMYSNMISMKKQQETIQFGREESSKVDMSILRSVTAPKTPVPSTIKRKHLAHRAEINASTFNVSGNLFATASSDKTVALWSSTASVQDTVFLGANQSVMSVNFSIGDEFILGASNDNIVRVWRVDSQRIRSTLTGHIGKVYAAMFTPDGKKVVTGSHDRTIKIWDLGSGDYCKRTIFCFASCNDLCLANDGGMICSAHLDSYIRLWDVRSPEKPVVLSDVHSKQVTSICLTPDHSGLLTCSRDNTLKIIDLKMNKVVTTFENERLRTETNWTRACISPDGNFVSVGSSQGSVFIWEAATGALKTVLEAAHARAVNTVSWSSLGDLCSCDRGGTVIYWK